MARKRKYTDEERILKHREHQAIYRKSLKGKKQRLREKKAEWFKKRRIKFTTNWRLRNPDKYSAHQAVSRALRLGRLERLSCEICGNPNTHGHHDNYKKQLNVIWLCPLHHRERHKQLA